MSQTISPGLVDESHWTFVAASMADVLRSGVGDPTGVHSRIPKGIYRAAREFFRFVGEALDESVPTNPVGSAANYAIAAKAVKASVGLSPMTEDESNHLLRKFSADIDRLSPEDNLDPPDAKSLEELAAFFEKIAAEGETKAYENYNSFEHRPSKMGF